MATMQDVKSLTFEAGQDLSSDQFKFVIQAAGDGQVDLCGQGLNATGVLLNNPGAAGEAATVAYAGVVKVEAGETLAPGDLIMSAAVGLAEVATATDQILGICQNDALIGELAEVLLDKQGLAV